MIFYFSGTGNSQGVAEIIAERLGDQAINIIGSNPGTVKLNAGDYLGFVFPIYAWAAPEIMLEFAAGLDPGEAFTFAVATYSNVAGLALQQFSQYLPLRSGYGLTMPDNFPVLDKILETEESCLEKLAMAEKRLEEIIIRIKAREEVFDILVGEDGENRTYKLSQHFNENQRTTAQYRAEKECTGCGLCEELCPAKAIELQDGVPVWIKEECYLCMACLNRCPVEAIEYGDYSKGKFRYYFKGFDASKYHFDKTNK